MANYMIVEISSHTFPITTYFMNGRRWVIFLPLNIKANVFF
jgi:hypothetical protein